jgi:hypothetical protein
MLVRDDVSVYDFVVSLCDDVSLRVVVFTTKRVTQLVGGVCASHCDVANQPDRRDSGTCVRVQYASVCACVLAYMTVCACFR